MLELPELRIVVHGCRCCISCFSLALFIIVGFFVKKVKKGSKNFKT